MMNNATPRAVETRVRVVAVMARQEEPPYAMMKNASTRASDTRMRIVASVAAHRAKQTQAAA